MIGTEIPGRLLTLATRLGREIGPEQPRVFTVSLAVGLDPSQLHRGMPERVIKLLLIIIAIITLTAVVNIMSLGVDAVRTVPVKMSYGDRLQEKFPRERNCWKIMKARCYIWRSKDFRSYGVKGVRVFSPWRTSFAGFLRDMGPMPPGATHLERISKQGGDYTPENCRCANGVATRTKAWQPVEVI